MVELMKEPSEGMLDAACDIDGHARLAQGKDEGASYADMFKAMSAELLKEVEK